MNAKRIINVILLLSLAVLSAWIYNRWNVWFGERVDPKYTPLSGVYNVQLTFGQYGTDERIVSWQMAEMNDSIVFKYTSDVLDDTVTVKPFKTQFVKKYEEEDVVDERVNVCYYNAVIPTVEVGRYSYSIGGGPWYDFDVRSQSNFTALCLGDIQNKQPCMRDLIDSIVNFVNPDFIIQAGDLVERPYNGYWDVYFDDFRNVTPHIPMLAVLGNHDYHKFPEKNPDRRFFLTFPYFHGSKASSTADVELPATYSLKYGNANFYLFDSNRFYPDLRRQAMDFISSFDGDSLGEFNVAIMHHPPYSAKSCVNNLDVRVALVDALKQKNIDLLIAGHEHTQQLRAPSNVDDIPFVQSISHLSQKNYSTTIDNSRTFSVLKYQGGVMSYLIYNELFELLNYVSFSRK